MTPDLNHMLIPNLVSYLPAFIRNRFVFSWLAKIALLLKRGRRLTDALSIVLGDPRLSIMLNVNHQIADDVLHGMRLSQAIRRQQGNFFPRTLWAEIEKAEERGDFIPTLEGIAWAYYKKPKDQKVIMDSVEELAKLDSPDADIALDVIKRPRDPIGRLVNMIIMQALKNEASGILLTVEQKKLKFEFIQNGRPVEQPSIQLKLAPDVFCQIETMAKMDYWKLGKQGGRCNFCIWDRHADIEVTTEKTDSYKKACLRISVKK